MAQVPKKGGASYETPPFCLFAPRFFYAVFFLVGRFSTWFSTLCFFP
jgi:type III secretory pathway component EscT